MAISKAISLCGSWLSTGIGKSSVNDIRLVLYGSPGLACYRDASIPNYRPGLVQSTRYLLWRLRRHRKPVYHRILS